LYLYCTSRWNISFFVFTNLNKLDDPNATQKDKAVDIAKATAAIAGLIPNPIICPAANVVIDTANYLTDFSEGRRNAQPKPTDINNKTNPMIGSGVYEVINSTPVRNFVNNFGYGSGIF
jgi:hypothetical protein